MHPLFKHALLFMNEIMCILFYNLKVLQINIFATLFYA